MAPKDQRVGPFNSNSGLASTLTSHPPAHCCADFVCQKYAWSSIKEALLEAIGHLLHHFCKDLLCYLCHHGIIIAHTYRGFYPKPRVGLGKSAQPLRCNPILVEQVSA